MKKKLLALLAVLSVLVFWSASVAQGNTTEAELKAYLDTKEAVFEDISVQMGVANWNVYSQEGEADQDTPKRRYCELFSNDTLRFVVDTWYGKRETIQDPVLRRRVEVWRNVLVGARVDMDEEVFKLENKLEALMADTDSMVDKPSQAEMATMVLKLMKLRNEKAMALGYANYAEMILDVTGTGVEWFTHLVDTIEAVTREPYRKLLAEIEEEEGKTEIGMPDVMKLIGKAFVTSRGPQIESERMLPLMKETLANIGIDYDAIPVRFVEKAVPYGGNGLAIQIPTDFRIVVNLNMPLSVWMHELGHGLQGVFTTIEYPILKGYEWCLGNEFSGYMEGMAETNARFARNPGWLKKYAEFTEEKIAKRKASAQALAPVMLRMRLAGCMLEIEYYKDLDQDMQELRDKLHKKYLLLDKPSDRPVGLAGNIIYVSYPVYTQNYLIADMISWQVHSLLEEKFGKEYVFNKKVGSYFANHFLADGELYPWQERLKRATGKELDVKGYLRSLGL